MIAYAVRTWRVGEHYIGFVGSPSRLSLLLSAQPRTEEIASCVPAYVIVDALLTVPDDQPRMDSCRDLAASEGQSSAPVGEHEVLRLEYDIGVDDLAQGREIMKVVCYLVAVIAERHWSVTEAEGQDSDRALRSWAPRFLHHQEKLCQSVAPYQEMLVTNQIP